MMTRDLLLALLSLDSYNRGYDRNVETPGDSLGNVTIERDSSILVDAEGQRLDAPAGFYAIAYNWNGETIISYRGTDELQLLPLDEFDLTDPAYGWGLASGNYWSPQAEYARDFYQLVAGVDQGADSFGLEVA